MVRPEEQVVSIVDSPFESRVQWRVAGSMTNAPALTASSAYEAAHDDETIADHRRL
jgi:hypothetical protein